MISVKVLSIKNCPATPPTISLVRSTARELGIDVEVTNIVINTLEEANERRFIGSPTVRINGLDIDPSMRSVDQFGLT